MVDLTVRGAGIFGLSVAWEAASRGARVRVVDPDGPGAGASGGIVGALQPHTPDSWNDKKDFQLESLMLQGPFWDAVEAVSGISPGYGRLGRLQPLQSERDVVLARTRAEAATQNWRGWANWDVIDADEAGQWRPASPTGLYIRDDLSARLHPRRAVESLAAALRSRGVEIVTEADDSTPTVWATGWRGLVEMDAGTGVKGQAALLRHDARGHPQIFAASLHIVPHADGTVAVGSTSERDFDDPASTDALLDDVIRRAGEVLPILKGAEVIQRWAGVRPRAASRAPLLGPIPGRPGHYVANGGFKIGFGMAPLVAQVICDLVLDGDDRIPDAFRA